MQSFPKFVRHVAMSSKKWFGPVKRYSLLDKWPVGIWAPPLWSMWMSCKLVAGSSNAYSFTGPNVHSTSIYCGKVFSYLGYCYPYLNCIPFILVTRNLGGCVSSFSNIQTEQQWHLQNKKLLTIEENIMSTFMADIFVVAWTWNVVTQIKFKF